MVMVRVCIANLNKQGTRARSSRPLFIMRQDYATALMLLLDGTKMLADSFATVHFEAEIRYEA